MIKKLITAGCAGALMLIGTVQASAFFGPFRSLFPCPVGYSGFGGCAGSFGWFSLPSSAIWPFCW